MTDQERIAELEQRIAELEYALAGTMISLSSRDGVIPDPHIIQAMQASKQVQFKIMFDDERIIMVKLEIKDA